MSRTARGLDDALAKLSDLRADFHENLKLDEDSARLHPPLERAGRVSDFFELAELMCVDAREREESCGGHFREEHQTEEGEAKRDDERFAYVAAWEFQGLGKKPLLHQEPLEFEAVQLTQRSYK